MRLGDSLRDFCRQETYCKLSSHSVSIQLLGPYAGLTALCLLIFGIAIYHYWVS